MLIDFFYFPQEDVQLILAQQVQIQQQAEQNQKKPSRMGILRRRNRSPIQRPATIPSSAPAPATTNSSQIFVSKSAVSTPPTPGTPPTSHAVTHRTWKDKLRRGKSSRPMAQDVVGQDSEWGKIDNGFQVISLD